MKRKYVMGAAIGLLITGGIIYAADHIDAPAVTGPGSTSLGTDITDLYAFQSPSDNSKMVFVIGTQGLLSPVATGSATFPDQTMYELNIDNNGDNVEDLIIQCLVQKGKLRVYGPIAPGTPGMNSMVKASASKAEAKVTPYGTNPVMGTGENGVKIFAGPRDDPFFFDLVRFKEIIAGTASSFRTPGVDTFANTNIMSIVVEVPKNLLGTAMNINVWAESKTKK
jgi:Domain of unknown function (DUF4331)